MNVKDENAGNLSLLQIAAVIFPISIIITLFTIVVAFRDKLQMTLSGLGINLRREKERPGDLEMSSFNISRRPVV